MAGYKINQDLGKRIQRVRKQKKVSQEKFAESIGVHRNQVGRIERGETNVPMYTFYKIVKALKIKAREILPF